MQAYPFPRLFARAILPFLTILAVFTLFALFPIFTFPPVVAVVSKASEQFGRFRCHAIDAIRIYLDASVQGATGSLKIDAVSFF
jgi:hypothetical protein